MKQDDGYDPLDDARKSWDVCISSLRAELVRARCKNPNLSACSILRKTPAGKSGAGSNRKKPGTSGGKSRSGKRQTLAQS